MAFRIVEICAFSGIYGACYQGPRALLLGLTCPSAVNDQRQTQWETGGIITDCKDRGRAYSASQPQSAHTATITGRISQSIRGIEDSNSEFAPKA